MRKVHTVAVVVGHNDIQRGAWAREPICRSEYEFNGDVALAMKSLDSMFSLRVEIVRREPASSYREEIRTAYEQVARLSPLCALELHFNSSDQPEDRGIEMLCRDDDPSLSLARTLASSVATALHLPLRAREGVRILEDGDRGWGAVSALSATPIVLCEPFHGSHLEDCAAALGVGSGGLASAYLRGVSDWLTRTMSV